MKEWSLSLAKALFVMLSGWVGHENCDETFPTPICRRSYNFHDCIPIMIIKPAYEDGEPHVAHDPL